MTPLETGWGLQRGWAAVINKGPSAPFSPYCTIAAICEAIAIFRSGAVTDYGIIKLKRGATSGRPTHDRHREGAAGSGHRVFMVSQLTQSTGAAEAVAAPLGPPCKRASKGERGRAAAVGVN